MRVEASGYDTGVAQKLCGHPGKEVNLDLHVTSQSEVMTWKNRCIPLNGYLIAYYSGVIGSCVLVILLLVHYTILNTQFAIRKNPNPGIIRSVF